MAKKRKNLSSTAGVPQPSQKRARQVSLRKSPARKPAKPAHRRRDPSVWREGSTPSLYGGCDAAYSPPKTDPHDQRTIEKGVISPEDDYSFRLRVVCEPNSSPDIVKGAVQGLSKICFPKDILDVLGLNVIQRHMREAGASEVNIFRMRQLYQTEMIQRLARKLGELMYDTEKAEAGVSALITAMQQQPGGIVDAHVLDRMIMGLQSIRDNLYESQARYTMRGGIPIASPAGDDTLVEVEGEAQVGGRKFAPVAIQPSLKHQNTEETQKSRPKQKKNKAESIWHIEGEQAEDDRVPSTEADVNTILTAANGFNQPQNMKLKDRLTRSGRWNVDPSIIKPEDLKYHFKKISDLYAFHAKPIVQKDLRCQLSDHDLYNEISSRWAHLSDAERKPWKDAFERLQSGDLTALKRGWTEIRLKHSAMRFQTPLPLPVGYKGHKGADHLEANVELVSERASGGNTDLQQHPAFHGIAQPERKVNIKREESVDSEPPLELLEHATSRGTGNASTASSVMLQGNHTDSPTIIQFRVDTPIVDLLWGQQTIQKENKKAALSVIKTNLERRVPTQTLTFRLAGEQKVKLRKSKLYRSMEHSFSKTSNQKLRPLLEKELSFWVALNPESFPELHAQPVIFIWMMPQSTPVLSNLQRSEPPFPFNAQRDLIQCVVVALRRRNIPGECTTGLDGSRLETMMNSCFCKSRAQTRSRLERLLRHLAFVYRDKFPELKRSDLVISWERMTGNKWQVA